MSKEVAHQKRVQAALSTTSAIAGLSALGTKGGAAAARKLAKPAVAAKLALKPKTVEALPKAAEHMDKFSLAALTTGAGVGGMGGLHFAALQRAEAKQQEKGRIEVGKSAFGVTHVSKAVYDLEAKRNEAAQAQARTLGQRAHKQAIAQGRFLRVDQEPNEDIAGMRHPAQQRPVPHARPLLRVTRKPQDYGGLNPEARRQRRMQGEAAGLAGASAATAVAAGGMEARNLVNRGERKKLTLQAAASEKRAGEWENLRNRASARNQTWRGAQTKSKNKLAKQPHHADYWNRQIERQGKFADRALGTNQRSHVRAEALRGSAAADTARAASLKASHGKAAALGVTALGMAAGAAAINHSRNKGQGRKYTDWWDG